MTEQECRERTTDDGDDERQERTSQERGTEDTEDDRPDRRRDDELPRPERHTGRFELGVDAVAEAAGFCETRTELRDRVGDPSTGLQAGGVRAGDLLPLTGLDHG